MIYGIFQKNSLVKACSRELKNVLSEKIDTLRAAVFTIGYFVSGIIYGALSLLTWVLPAKLRHRIIIYWTYFGIFWLRVTCGVKYKLIGAENIKRLSSPVVVMSKHQSTWETLYLQGLFFPACTILKRELLRIPCFGWGLLGLNAIGIDRANPRLALKQVKEGSSNRISRGYNIIVFPEGTRIPPGARGKYARSGADIAINTNVSIIPVAVNSGHFWPPKKFNKIPGVITVVVGPPISPENKTSRELSEDVENWIESQMTTLSPFFATEQK